ncbi:MAG: GNAT family N-acetyltransferase [Clostridia bacterium]|nr:GNAT family N-acetyltransferase [Clostridia bacterium]
MVYSDTLNGKFVYLRSVTIEDAEAILSLRQNPKLTKYLPRLDITVEQQRKWIEEQRTREGDYYFSVWNRQNEMIGTIRVYNISDGSGETGSLALKGNAFENLEAKLLCEDFQWDILNLHTTKSVIDAENSQAQKFAGLFGTEFNAPSLDARGFQCVIGHNDKERSIEYRNKVRKILYKNENNV